MIGGHTLQIASFVSMGLVRNGRTEAPVGKLDKSHIFDARRLPANGNSILFAQRFARALLAILVLTEAGRQMKGVDIIDAEVFDVLDEIGAQPCEDR